MEKSDQAASSSSTCKRQKTASDVDVDEKLNNDFDASNEQQLSGALLDHIFQYLPATALFSAAQVSRSWNDAAKRVISSRGSLRCLTFPLWPHAAEVANVYDYFVTKPKALIIFQRLPGPDLSQSRQINWEHRKYINYMEDLRRYMSAGDRSFRIILVSAAQIVVNNKYLPSLFEPTEHFNEHFHGLCIPASEDLTVKTARCSVDELASEMAFILGKKKFLEEEATRVFAELQPDSVAEKPIFLIFAGKNRPNVPYQSSVLEMLREKYINETLNLWGGQIDFVDSDNVFPGGLFDDSDEAFTCLGCHFYGILLHSPKLQAHCLVLQLNDGEGQMAERLAEFRRSIELRRHSVGLVSGPICFDEEYSKDDSKEYCRTTDEMMEIIKEAFPTIVFTGVFGRKDGYYYGYDHLKKDEDYQLEHQEALSIMVLTYDD